MLQFQNPWMPLAQKTCSSDFWNTYLLENNQCFVYENMHEVDYFTMFEWVDSFVLYVQSLGLLPLLRVIVLWVWWCGALLFGFSCLILSLHCLDTCCCCFE